MTSVAEARGGAAGRHVMGQHVRGQGQVTPLVLDAAPLLEGEPVGDRQVVDGHVQAGRHVEDAAGVVAADGQLDSPPGR